MHHQYETHEYKYIAFFITDFVRNIQLLYSMATTTDSKTPTHASNVYLFKNGYGMIVKIFEFPPNKDNNDQPVELIDPPSNPVHGTFWIQSFSNNSMLFSLANI